MQEIKKGLTADADTACLESWKKAKFNPALQGEETVAITNFPVDVASKQWTKPTYNLHRGTNEQSLCTPFYGMPSVQLGALFKKWPKVGNWIA